MKTIHDICLKILSDTSFDCSKFEKVLSSPPPLCLKGAAYNLVSCLPVLLSWLQPLKGQCSMRRYEQKRSKKRASCTH